MRRPPTIASSVAAPSIARQPMEARSGRTPAAPATPEAVGAAAPAAPRIWVLMGRRPGDNAQLTALAEGLGRPYEIKRLVHRRLEFATNLLFDATLLGCIAARSSPLGPPWPDLVLSAGRRSEPVARWIREHADRRVKLVHLGRPWRDARAFDLVVATPQYPIETTDGVLRNPLPLHGVTTARLAAAAAEWRSRFAHLPRPWIALFVGGSNELFTLDARTAARLARDASALARASGGSLLVTTSARTPARAADALAANLDVPAEFFRWRPEAPENPYWGYLALADGFVVTGDSVSMLTEACATGKRVHIFAPGRESRRGSADLVATLRRRFLNFGIPRLGRDLRRVHDELVRRGHATFLGDVPPRSPAPAPDHLETTVARVRELLDDPAPPRVWAVMCYRAGENSQIRALAEALGWRFEEKHLAYRRLGRLLDVWRGTTLLGIVRKRSSPLAPPWPDLVISAAMRNEPVCRWIRKQSAGRTRYVHVGKPWARAAGFDLVISVPEYHVPSLPNVLSNQLSLHAVSAERLADAARRWEASLARLPRPFVAVLVGGYSGAYALDRERAQRLGRAASAMAGKQGGSLLVTTSARTSRAAIDALVAAIDVPHRLYRWSRETHADPEANPYLGFLALADSIVVTCDSSTMLAEACATRKPVYMFDLGRDGDDDVPLARPTPWWRRCGRDRIRALLYRHLMLGLAPRKLRRDLRPVHQALIASGRAVWVGRPFPERRPPPLDEMPRSLERVRALVADAAAAGRVGSEDRSPAPHPASPRPAAPE